MSKILEKFPSFFTIYPRDKLPKGEKYTNSGHFCHAGAYEEESHCCKD